MKKVYFIILSIFFVLSAGVLHAIALEEINAQVTLRAQEAEKQYVIVDLVKQGNVARLRKALINLTKEDLLGQDVYGNNVLHLAKKKEMFVFLWNLFSQEEREQLLAQRNKSGEIPMMAHIIYGQEDIFLEYFPKTHLYEQFKSVTADLQKEGLAREVAQTKQDELLRQSSIGSHTLWSRAHAFYQGAMADTHYAPYRHKMKKIMEQLEKVAPFLVTQKTHLR